MSHLPSATAPARWPTTSISAWARFWWRTTSRRGSRSIWRVLSGSGSSAAPIATFLTTAGSARIVFNGLVGLVENELHQQVESGDLFLFFNRRGDRVKVMWFAGDGLVIWYKRLEAGTFEVPRAARAVRDDGSIAPAGIEMRLSDLTLILEGIDLASARRLCRPPSLRSNVTCCRAAYLPQLATVDARGRSTRIAGKPARRNP